MNPSLQRTLGKVALLVALVTTSSTSLAGGWTAWAVPTRVDVVRTEGLMVYGSFGNPGGCTVPDQFFVAINHPQYNQIYATLMTAMVTGRQIMAYSIECDSETWYSVPATTYNTVTAGSAVNMQ
jgi:hypothetical protein